MEDHMILKLYIDAIKEVGGRGPKNIYVKVMPDRIEIHFWLVKSPLEVFIVEKLEGGHQLLEQLYTQIEALVRKRFFETFQEQFGFELTYFDFKMDIPNDRFTLVVKKE